MLIARLLTRLREMQTLHVFLLEILAVFIGISASLFVDDWRQEREDYETLDRLLQDIHYNALLARTSYRGEFISNSLALESTVELAYGDIDEYSDEELLAIFSQATLFLLPLEPLPGYARLSNAGLSIPFDRTMAELDASFTPLNAAILSRNETRGSIAVLVEQLYFRAGLLGDVRNWDGDGLTVDARRRQAAIVERMVGNERLVGDMADAESLRMALRSPEGQAALKGLINHRNGLNGAVLYMDSAVDMIIQVIRRRIPGITLPIEGVGIDGSGTGRDFSVPDIDEGPSLSVAMQQSADNPNVWNLTLDLVDGEIKFRADDNWATNWGSPFTFESVGGSSGFEYGGDPDAVFPRGTAEMNGRNIPVRAGRYDITFNSQTFEYSFDRVDSGGETDD